MDTFIADIRPEMSPELSWAIITLFSIIIVWVTIRYINRLDIMIERIDTAIEGIIKTQIQFGLKQENHDEKIESHEERIKRLEEQNRNKRRGNV
jgi:hypothetical protein